MENELLLKINNDFEKAILCDSIKSRSEICGAYAILHVLTGKFYVGGTGGLKRRIEINVNCLKRNDHHNKFLQEAYNNDSRIEVRSWLTNTEEEAFDIEQELLDNYHAAGLLFNISINARKSALGIPATPWSIETKEKRRLLTLAQWSDPVAREKLRVSHLGNIPSNKMRSIIGFQSSARWRDPVYRSKMSEVSIKRWSSIDARTSHSIVMHNYWSPEKRSKASLRMTERLSSIEKRQKLSISSTNAWKNQEYRDTITIARNTPEAILNASNKKKADWERPEFRENQISKRNEIAFKNNQRENGIKQMSTAEARKISSNAAKAQWLDPDYRNKKIIDGKLQWEDPEYRLKMQANIDSHKKKVSINGTIYDSITSAAKAINVTAPNLVSKLKSSLINYNDYFYIIKDKQ